MAKVDQRTLQELAGQAMYLARLRDRRRITDSEYLKRLDNLRLKCGLPPISMAADKLPVKDGHEQSHRTS